jgi:hypothetical protein
MRTSWVSRVRALLSARIRWPVFFFASVSTLYGMWFFFNEDTYLPWRVRCVRGVEMGILMHLGLWLSTIAVRSRLRFLLPVFLLPSAVAIFFLWWNIHLTLAIAVLIFLFWTVVQTLKKDHLAIR